MGTMESCLQRNRWFTRKLRNGNKSCGNFSFDFVHVLTMSLLALFMASSAWRSLTSLWTWTVELTRAHGSVCKVTRLLGALLTNIFVQTQFNFYGKASTPLQTCFRCTDVVCLSLATRSILLPAASSRRFYATAAALA